jgi:hypothetical protein
LATKRSLLRRAPDAISFAICCGVSLPEAVVEVAVDLSNVAEHIEFIERRLLRGVSSVVQAVLGGGDEHAGSEVAFVVLAAQGVHLTGALEVDVLALVPIWIESVEGALHDESWETDDLCKIGCSFLFCIHISDI